MYTGLTDLHVSVIKARRLDGLWQTSNVIAAILNSAGKSLQDEVSAKTIYDQLSGESSIPVDDPHYEYEGGSLAALKEERRLREEAERERASAVVG